MKPMENDPQEDVPAPSKPKPRHLQQRPHRLNSSRERNGQSLDEDARNNTIRAVTPDDLPSPNSIIPAAEPPQRSPITFTTSDVDSGSQQSPTYPTSRKGQAQGRRDISTSVSQNIETHVGESKRRKEKQRSGHRDDQPSDASPGSFVSKARKRLGSIATGSTGSSRNEEVHASIGFPSVVSPAHPELFDDKQNPRTPRRALSPENMQSSTPSRGMAPLGADSNKILQLMKTTCGRMHGILFFRPMHTSAWASGYCAINVAPGSLVCQVKGEVAQTKTLIPDLRGCSVRTHYDTETQSTYLSVIVAASGAGFQLRPPVPETFDSWLAALLCWQPLRPRGIHNKMTKPQPVAILDRKPVGQRRVSDASTGKSTAIMKVGKMLLWDGPIPSGSQLQMVRRGRRSPSPSPEHHAFWRDVSCTLHENGNFKLLTDTDARTISVTKLSQLARCAVQRLDFSVLNRAYCIAVYPYYTVQGYIPSHWKPMILCLESRTAYEAWFVLLRALTVPELYGPEQQQIANQSVPETEKSLGARLGSSGMFRIERVLTVRVIEAKFLHSLAEREIPEPPSSARGKQNKRNRHYADVYAEVACDKDLRARTNIKQCTQSVFWADEFTLEDLSSTLTTVSVAIRMGGNPGEKEWTMTTAGSYDSLGDAGYLTGVGMGAIEISTHDPVVGQVDVQLDELEQHGTIDKWWPLHDNNDQVVGQMLMKFSLQETVVLMNEEYRELLSLLQNFPNGLTTQIAQTLGPELKQVSDHLLDIFQATDSAVEWINTLVEEEIDGIYKEAPHPRMRFSGRVQSNDSYESAEHRELVVRDLSRSATMEANLLFRGNSLVTKSVDSHMRRLGRDYLEQVLGEKLRTIVEKDPECEVDPIKVGSSEQLEKNWANLIFLTTTVWKSIAGSAFSCPPGLRLLLKHVQSCAEDRYGSFIRTVKYTSVSGFLFLRFFCPAILNPKLFGILNDHPPDHTKRTFTLIAKSLQVLANMSRFGTKEPWMEPMNRFLTASTPEFRTFIEELCSISSSQSSTSLMEPQFAAPKQIRNRLPPASLEGLPSLPFLLDATKLLAELVDLWATHAPANIVETKVDEPIKRFHSICVNLHQKSTDCLSRAEQAERPNGTQELKWEQLLTEQQQKKTELRNHLEEQFITTTSEGELTALPQTLDSIRDEDYNGTSHGPELEGDTTPSSSASAAWDKRIPYPQRTGDNKALTNSTNSSTVSLEILDESRSRQIPGSRDGTAKHRILDLMGSSARNKRKNESRTFEDSEANNFI